MVKLCDILSVYCNVNAGVTSYKIKADADELRAEIMKNGPVQVEFIVYEDFLLYKSGK